MNRYLLAGAFELRQAPVSIQRGKLIESIVYNSSVAGQIYFSSSVDGPHYTARPRRTRHSVHPPVVDVSILLRPTSLKMIDRLSRMPLKTTASSGVTGVFGKYSTRYLEYAHTRIESCKCPSAVSKRSHAVTYTSDGVQGRDVINAINY